MALNGSNDAEKLFSLSEKKHKEQAVWFLNAFWDKLEKDSEKIWDYTHKFESFDLEKGKNGHELDELNAHRFLEAFHETMTVKEMRDKLRAKQALKEKGVSKYISLVHFLATKYDVNIHHLVNASQGDNQAELIEAQRKLEEAQQACEEAQRTEKEAKLRETEARNAKSALDAEQEAYDRRTDMLKKKSEEGGVVARNKAKNELAQHLSEDPLPLRRARITQEVAVKRATDAREKAEAALAHAVKVMKECEDYLEEVKARSGSGQGSVWWMQRELHEAKKFMPTSKGGIRK